MSSRTINIKLGTLVVLAVMVVVARSVGGLKPPTASLTNPPIAVVETPDVDRPVDDDAPAPELKPNVDAPPPIAAPATPAPAPVAPAPVVPPVVPASTFRNGNYYAVGDFSTDGGIESIGVTVVLSDDVVVDSAITPMATHQTSLNYEQKFIANYKRFVVGKKIDEIILDKKSGASLTSMGFNQALNKIEIQARS